jgi:hypothetical protein
MGRHDDITPERLRADLRRFAQLVLRLDEEGRLLEGTPRVMKMMGDLRQKLFAYEVRGAGRLAPSEPEVDPDSPEVQDSLRIVEEALRRAREAEGEWGGPGRGYEED